MPKPVGQLFNVPNQITCVRLALSFVLFGLIVYEYYLTSLVFFILAAGTDFLDGYYARKFNQVTALGRILDPFADKIIICGTFIFLAATPGMMASFFGLKGMDGGGYCGPRVVGDGAAEFFGRARQRFLGQYLWQAEDGRAVRGGRGFNGLPALPNG